MAAQATDKQKTLDSAVFQIQKQFGKGSIMRLGAGTAEKIPAISTGLLSIDIATGIGGVPKGRVTEVYGPESSGKTTFSLHCIAEAQKAGGVAAFIDAEHALDVQYAEKLGVNIDDLLVSQPDYGEQALEIAEILIRSNAVDIIVIDSVAALVPKTEIDGNIGDTHVGLQARLMSQAMRKLSGVLNRANTALLFINQIRMKIGVMYGNPETTPGGNALKFYSSMRIEIRKITAIKDGTDMVGNRTRVKLVKNKVAPPFKIAEFDIIYGEGMSKTGDLLDMSVELGVVEKSGSWYSHNGERIGQGRENAKAFLKEHADISEDIKKKVMLGLGMDVDEPAKAKAKAEVKQVK